MFRPIYTVDAFTDRAFAGNPAGVCLLEQEPPVGWMQAVAAEMSLAETAFLWKFAPAHYGLRWFTPVIEVDLCGHATLASAHVLWEQRAAPPQLSFHTKSGALTAVRHDGKIRLDFPSEPPAEVVGRNDLCDALGAVPIYVGRNRFDFLVEVENEATVRSLEPNLKVVQAIAPRGVIVTARSANADYDFVSRFFAPAAGVPEDPVTGSAHCCLGPYWSSKLETSDLVGRQLSRRGGVVWVSVRGDRVLIAGHAVTVMKGELTIDVSGE